MSETCEHCGTVFAYCAQGEYCPNKECPPYRNAINEQAVNDTQTIARLEGELAARQPDESPGDVIHAEPDGTIVLDDGITTWNPRRACEFLLAASRADAYRSIVEALDADGDWESREHAIRALITPTDAAARAERDRRIRLEEAANWFNAQKTGSYHEWAWNRFRELRAPVPAELEPYPDNVAGCTCPAPCKGTRHGPRDLSLERAGDAVKQFSACRVCGCDNKIRPGCHCVCHD